ncbi:hypothetical protein GGR00_002153 [Aminobacter aganoensis]|uniref:Uncharacterized protein n=1 Tax=Aminobacter aganoensis TaxID=83264 RepID=A0A7X0F799_9HYPH|nr:hypothetical protein [Aminobacter aganoensis]
MNGAATMTCRTHFAPVTRARAHRTVCHNGGNPIDRSKFYLARTHAVCSGRRGTLYHFAYILSAAYHETALSIQAIRETLRKVTPPRYCC